MNELPPRDRRLDTEFKNMQKLTEDSSLVRFEAKPELFPEEYIVTFSCLGLASKPPQMPGILRGDWRQRRLLPWVRESHTAHIYLPARYPIQPPQIHFKTPIYHPNIKTLSEQELVAILAERVGGIENVRQTIQEHPELQEKMRQRLATYICLDGLKPSKEGGNYTMRLTLYDICHELGQIIMFQRYNLADPLDMDARDWTAWAEKQGILPIDNRPFLDKLSPVIRVID